MKELEENNIPQKQPAGGEISTESFASLSPEELASAMERMLDDLTEENYDPQLLNAYLDALDEKAPMPPAPDAKESFARFQEKLRAAVPAEEVPPARRVRRRTFRRMVVTVAATMALLLALLVGAQAAGLDVFGNLARWTDDLFWFLPSSGQEETSEYYSLFQEALENQSLPKELAPTWYPEGFSAGEPEVWDDETGVSVQLTFTNTEDGRSFAISVDQLDIDPSADFFEKDTSPVEVYTSQEKTFYIFSNVNATIAVWADNDINLSIIGSLSVEETKGIINSIGGFNQ